MARENFFPIPDGEIKVENPDGVFRRDGSHSAYDTGDRGFPIQSGDWQTRQVKPGRGDDPTS